MKRPIALVLALLIFGIVSAYFFSEVGLVFLASSLVFAGLLYVRFKKVLYSALVLFSFFGFFLCSNAVNPSSAELEKISLSQAETGFEGTVKSVSKTTSGFSAVVQLSKSFSGEREINADADVKIYFEETGVEIGDILAFSGKLQKLDGQRNPGGFNELLYSKSRGIEYKAFLETVEIKGHSFKLWHIFSYARNIAEKNIDKVFGNRHAGLMKAMMLGINDNLDSEDTSLYKDIGIFHILTVSGLHFGVLAMVLEAVLSFFLFKRQSVFISLIIVVFYCCLIGAGAASLRSVLMYAAVSLGFLLRRDKDTISYVCLSAIVILIFQPLFIFDLGFQYSFTAVFGMMFLAKPVSELVLRLFEKLGLDQSFLAKKKFLDSVSAMFAATIATLPITLFYNGSISVVSILANLIIIPTVTILIVSGFIIIIFGLFLSPVAGFFAVIASSLLAVYEIVGLILTAVPFAVIYPGSPHLLWIFGFYLLLCLWIFVSGSKTLSKVKLFKACLILTMLFFSAAAIASFLPVQFSATMLDVGQGDCTVIQNTNERTYIVDGGGRGEVLGNSTGVRVLIPYLKYRGVSEVEAVFVSHLDFDHAGGIIELLDTIKVKKLFIALTEQNLESEVLELLGKKAKSKSVEICYIEKGFSAKDGSLVIDCLYPFEDSDEDEANDRSLVLKFNFLDYSMLFCGDLSSKIERVLVDIYGAKLHCTAYKLTHHGSKYSNSAEMLKTVEPLFVFCGASKNNVYGHPAAETLERLQDLNIKKYITANNGAITIRSNGFDVDIHVMQN